MFGTYRTLLALLVVVNHFTPITTLGAYAVFAFFILSGYLMTWVMQRSYGYTYSGRLKFAINRVLRIFPIYWVSCAVSIVLIIVFGESVTKQVISGMYLPNTLDAILSNIFLIFTFFSEPKLSPPAWALTVELTYYALIAVGLSKSKRITVIWFSVSLIYTLYLNVSGAPWGDRYFSFLAASFPFAIGGMIFHFKDILVQKIPGLMKQWLPYLLFAMVLVNFAIAHESGTMRTYGFLINIALNAALILVLSLKQSDVLISKGFDNWLGQLSYPIYLIHFQVAVLLVGIRFPIPYQTYMFFFMSLPIVLLSAWLLAVGVEKPIERIRQNIKQS